MRSLVKALAITAAAAGLFVPGSVFGHGNEPGESSATIGGGKVTVKYVAPSARGRDVMSLIQPGSYWRMGADKATTLTSEVDLMFGDTKVPKGEYTLVAHFIGERKWELVAAESVTTPGWQPQGMVASVPAKLDKLDTPVEHMTIKLEGHGSKGKLTLQWGTSQPTAEFSASSGLASR
ncbi:MAG: DUF2911 domain-containing protein [Nitrospinota bacterium]